MSTQQLATTNEKPKAIQVINGNLQIETIDDLWRLSKMFCASGLCPQNLDTPEKVSVVLQGGAELGFKPWQSLQILHVVNGRLGMEGSAMLAKIRKSGVCEYVKMFFEGVPYEENYRAIVKSKRRNESVEYVTDFSVEDAKRAKLWGVKDNWNKYPKDMLTWRAVSRHARRYYTDEIWAMYTPDELANIESVPLEETFEDAQTEATTKIESEQGSEPVNAEFEEKLEPTEKAKAKNKLCDFICPECGRKYRYGIKEGIGVPCECGKANIVKAEKKRGNVKKNKKADIKFLFTCKNPKCELEGFDEPKTSGTGAKQVSICPKCLSKNIASTEDVKPPFMED